jgi:hypothetical protein
MKNVNLTKKTLLIKYLNINLVRSVALAFVGGTADDEKPSPVCFDLITYLDKAIH